MDISAYLGKPYYLKIIPWANTITRFATIGGALLPYDSINAIPALRNAISVGAMFRTKFCVNLHMTGTIGHQGTLLAAVIPATGASINTDLYTPGIINTLLSSPHAFLSANEASSVCIEVPFYVHTDLAYMQTELGGTNTSPDLSWAGSKYAQLIVVVLNPLVPATGASTSLNLVVETTFKELELYVPHPTPLNWVTQSGEQESSKVCTPACVCSSLLLCGRALCCCAEFVVESGSNLPNVTIVADSPGSDRKDLAGFVTRAADFITAGAKVVTGDFFDTLRRTFRYYTGLHNPNKSKLDKKMIMSLRNYANQIDSGTCMEKMDPYSDFDRVTRYPIFRTHEDEMMMANILSKPQYIGSFQVSTSNIAGRLLWSRPISPWQGGCSGGKRIANNIEAMYWMSRAWKGDMELIIQSVMTPKHNLKLKVSKLYSPDKTAFTSYPTILSIANTLSDSLEFSQGGQTMVVPLPYLSRNQMLYNTKDPRANALQHGIYYIYLMQPLVSTDGVASTVEFNVYLRCKDNFSYFGYSTDPVAVTSGFTSSAREADAPNDPAPIDGVTLVNRSSNPNKTSSSTNSSNSSKSGGNTTTVNKPKVPVKKLNNPTPLEQMVQQTTNLTAQFVTESAEVMNAPSSQRELLDNGEKQDELVIDRMIPLVDVRPLVRRFQYSGRYTYTHSPDATNTIMIPVGDLIDSWRTAKVRGSKLVASRMYYGFNGGVKYKLKVMGAASATLRYIPPAVCINNALTTYFKLQPDTIQQGYWLENSADGANPSVMSELNAVTHPVFGSSISTISLFEGVIPNNTIYNFLGSMDWFRSVGDDSSTVSPMNNLGHLYVDLNMPEGSTDTVTVIAYSAFTDETRFGFHCFAPVLNIPLTAADTAYLLTGEIPTGTIGGAPTIVPIAQPLYAYYNTLTTNFT